MGLLRNYRWLKARDLKPYPKPDFAKLAGTKSELDLLEYIRKISGVVEVFHSARINQIIKGIDITEIFRALKKGNKAKAEQNEMI